MTGLQRQVLVVDDEVIIAMGLMDEIEEMGLTVCGSASTAEGAIELARLHRPMVVLMDLRLSGSKDGVDAAVVIHDEVGSKVVFITGSQEPSSLARIRSDHPSAILIKPISSQQLRNAVDAAIALCEG